MSKLKKLFARYGLSGSAIVGLFIFIVTLGDVIYEERTGKNLEILNTILDSVFTDTVLILCCILILMWFLVLILAYGDLHRCYIKRSQNILDLYFYNIKFHKRRRNSFVCEFFIERIKMLMAIGEYNEILNTGKVFQELVYNPFLIYYFSIITNLSCACSKMGNMELSEYYLNISTNLYQKMSNKIYGGKDAILNYSLAYASYHSANGNYTEAINSLKYAEANCKILCLLNRVRLKYEIAITLLNLNDVNSAIPYLQYVQKKGKSTMYKAEADRILFEISNQKVESNQNIQSK